MIYRLGDFQFPSDPASLYPQTANRPWVLEVGFGDGRFWPHYAQTFVEPPNYLGVEISGVSLLKAHRRLRQAGLDNTILTKLPAEVLLPEVIPHGALDAIVVNFPDPWPKAGHEEHRLLRVPFFQVAASRLKPGGAVLLTTDHEEYFAFACAQAEASGVMRVELTGPPPAALETKYALKWRDLGLEAQHARFVPTQHSAVPHRVYLPYPATPEDPAVPHSIIQLPATFDPATFAKHTARDPRGTWTVVLLDLYASLRRDGWVALAHVVEGDLTQEVLIDVTNRADGSTLVRLGRFGGPIITPGVKAAVGVLTDQLAELGAEVQHRGY
ncbi:tRNA (guanine(46)-N(7))-methyltransferase TrmB [Deinococcus radiophilus]|uniref:tRNA (guanine-N(7)-)-methyltransferase n=1 Tax=Deinococcus radiophilus TaxID=32062 RepID=A0A3S0K9M0_9DEIO|nr:tRNA (guanine-N7)-methyltransferase [Deinococcus radiophilus]RTR25726.1 tRNA (guanine-N7)-methyltransferase [Deinococcus radiophilus]UFA50201.1 tRNA (guanine-N7)-methyltransferase [Deinococcus radiophilus]